MAATVPLRLARSDPLPSEPSRFVVGGQAGNGSGDVKLYEWHRQRGDMRLVGLQTDVGQIKALEWSPSPVHRHLVALGQSTGRTILLSLTAKTLSLPLSNHSAAAALPAATVSILPIKHTRAVTALSFCPADPNYLATGYERHRSDYSLLIWDLSTSLASLPPDGNANWQRPLDRLEVTNPTARDATRLNPSEPRHIQHYCPSEHVNSLAFLSTGQQLLASANNKVIRLYDLRTPGPTQNAPPKDPSSALTAGASLQWHTRAVSSLLPDPLHASRFASFEASPGGSASSVRLWDSRKPNVEVLSFDVRGAVLGMEWLQVTNSVARLGVGTREGVAIWDIVSGTTVDEEHVEEWVTIGGLRNVVKPKQPLHSFAFANSVDEHRSDVMFVVKDGTIGIGPITPPPVVASGSRGDVVFSARDLRTMDPDTPVPSVKDGPSRPQDKDDDGRSDASGDEEAEFSRTNRFQLQPHRITTILEEASRSRPNSRASSIHRGMIPEKGNRGWEHPTPRFDENFRDGGDIGWNGWMRTLRSDVGCVMRQRAEEGYGTSNLLLNAAIATRYPGHERLAGIWEFIHRKSINGNKSLQTDLTHTMDATTSSTRSVNLTYAGIHSIWTGQDLHHQSPDSPSSTASLRSHSTALNEATRAPREVLKQGSAAWTSLRNTQMPNRAQSTPASSTTSLGRLDTPEEKEPVLPQADFASAVEIINGKREAEDHPGHVGTSKLPRTERTAQRKMILAVCGEMDAGNVNRSMEEEERTKAASWAYFSGEEENAVRILMNSNNSKHRLLGTTLAGFLSQSRATRANEFFDEHWRSLTNRVDDPYIRAVLSRVGGDGWESVLEEEAMPLLDRIAIAVCNLPDDELGAFLKNRLARFSRNPSPSLSSLSLTGFTSPAITFMQRWLERTGDVQTVALLSAYFPQSRLTYRECQMVKKWVEGYRDLLDGWGMWGERVEFDVGRMDIGRGLGEDRRSDDDGTGGVGTCPLCNNTLSKVHKEHLQLKSGLTRERSAPNERTGACTLCGQTLPRCVICLRHVESKSYTGHRDEFDFDDNTPSLTDTIDQAYVCCLTCRHGGHANHIVPWFQGGLDGEPGHDTCPVAGCPCECANI